MGYQGDMGGFLDGVRHFTGHGATTRTEISGGIPYFTNAFWTSGQRQAHSLHEISYRACFKGQLPAFFIERLTAPGDRVHDPFMGRGTTLLQAALMGRRVSGADINPICEMLIRPRLGPVSLQEITAALADIDWSRGAIEREDLLVFYHPTTLAHLEALRCWLSEHAPLGGPVDPIADWIRMVALNRLSGHSAGFFSVRSMPPNQAVSVASQARINARNGQTPPERDVAALIVKKSRSLLRDGCLDAPASATLLTADARATPRITSGSVDLVVTSPPFLDVVQYGADNWLRCWFAGVDPDRVEIAMHRETNAWMNMVRGVLTEQARILRPGGVVAFEVGEVRGGRVLLEQLVWQAADGLPFERIGVLVNDQAFTKTANCWGVANGVRGTNTNRIVLLSRR